MGHFQCSEVSAVDREEGELELLLRSCKVDLAEGTIFRTVDRTQLGAETVSLGGVWAGINIPILAGCAFL